MGYALSKLNNKGDMKRLILIFTLMVFSQTIKAAIIENITLSRISDQEINVHIGTRFPQCYSYNTFQYSITGNTIILQICYDQLLCSEFTQLQNDFQIPLENLSTNNFTLIVNTYYSTIDGCDYSFLIDSKTVSFSTPINTTIVLLSTVEYINNSLTISPNPTNGILEIRNENNIDSIGIYDSASRLIKTFTHSEQRIDLTGLAEGMYLVELKTGKEKIIRKVIIQK